MMEAVVCARADEDVHAGYTRERKREVGGRGTAGSLGLWETEAALISSHEVHALLWSAVLVGALLLRTMLLYDLHVRNSGVSRSFSYTESCPVSTRQVCLPIDNLLEQRS